MSRRLAAYQSTYPSTYAERIVSVTGLLDGLAEARLERVTRTARRLYGVQSAAILLWRGSRVVHQAWCGEGAQPTAVLAALGQEAVRCGAPRVVTDTFATTGAHFVAIVPLAVERGLSGGCLYLLDERARPFGTDDLQSLGDLATWAENELDVVHMGQKLALRMA